MSRDLRFDAKGKETDNRSYSTGESPQRALVDRLLRLHVGAEGRREFLEQEVIDLILEEESIDRQGLLDNLLLGLRRMDSDLQEHADELLSPIVSAFGQDDGLRYVLDYSLLLAGHTRGSGLIGSEDNHLRVHLILPRVRPITFICAETKHADITVDGLYYQVGAYSIDCNFYLTQPPASISFGVRDSTFYLQETTEMPRVTNGRDKMLYWEEHVWPWASQTYMHRFFDDKNNNRLLVSDGEGDWKEVRP